MRNPDKITKVPPLTNLGWRKLVAERVETYRASERGVGRSVPPR